MKNIIILLTAFLFVGCSVMTSDFSEMRRTIQKTEIIVENPKTVEKLEEENPKVAEKEIKIDSQETLVEQSSEITELEESIEEKATETEKEEIVEEVIDIEGTKIEETITEDENLIETVEEDSTETLEEKTVEEIIVENDTLKISKSKNIYKIISEDTVVEFTEEEVVDNGRFMWIVPNQSCVYEFNSVIFFVDNSNGYFTTSLEK